MNLDLQSVPHVVIIGAGFGGLNAAKALAKTDVNVTLIDRNNYHLFQPLLYQVATAGLGPNEIAYPIRGILRKQTNLTFRMSEVENINLKEKLIICNQEKIHFDYLILAIGSETNYFGNTELAEKSFGLKDIRDAEAIRNHILTQFEKAVLEEDQEERKKLLTFVIVGGGPTGVELAGAISELVRLVLKKDFPDLNVDEVSIILLEALDQLLMHLDESLSKATLNALGKKGVTVRFGQKVRGYDGQQVELEKGEPINTKTIIWTAGVRTAGLIDSLNLDKAAQNQVRVLPTLQLPQYPQVFVIGDAAYFEDQDGKALPMVAQVAIQQAERAAENLKNMLNNQPLEPFKYKDLGSMTTIGRNQAVAEISRFKFQGFLAWLIWLFVHLMQLVGFRNRVVVFINWVWEYITYERAARLIERE